MRDSTVYISFYLLIGAGFTGIILLLFDRAGLSLRDDALERRNPAAAVALAGTTVGSMAAFAGANIGDGPGWWVVIFCALLSNGALLTGWLVLDRMTGMGEAITIDRDMAAAGRAAGWLTGGGIVFGRAAAGDWTHVRATVHDFIGVAVGGLVLLGAAIVLERFLRSSGERRDALVFGGIPAGIYICGAIAYITRFHPL